MLNKFNKTVKNKQNYIMYGTLGELLSNLIQYYQSPDPYTLLYQQYLWI